VTVVEWGEGLAEGLAADRLEITITPAAAGAPAASAPVVGAAVAGDLPSSGPLPGETAAGSEGDPDDPAGDMPRMVRISAVGERWEGVKLPLASLADRL
jgi:tRNA threonylcarbamoyladenosine biosynthesis protein TsaE